jgi:hypothetical protein
LDDKIIRTLITDYLNEINSYPSRVPVEDVEVFLVRQLIESHRFLHKAYQRSAENRRQEIAQEKADVWESMQRSMMWKE